MFIVYMLLTGIYCLCCVDGCLLFMFMFVYILVVVTGVYIHVYFLVVTQGFCVCVDMVHGLSASELLLGLKSKGVRSPDVSRALGRSVV